MQAISPSPPLSRTSSSDSVNSFHSAHSTIDTEENHTEPASLVKLKTIFLDAAVKDSGSETEALQLVEDFIKNANEGTASQKESAIQLLSSTRVMANAKGYENVGNLISNQSLDGIDLEPCIKTTSSTTNKIQQHLSELNNNPLKTTISQELQSTVSTDFSLEISPPQEIDSNNSNTHDVEHAEPQKNSKSILSRCFAFLTKIAHFFRSLFIWW